MHLLPSPPDYYSTHPLLFWRIHVPDRTAVILTVLCNPLSHTGIFSSLSPLSNIRVSCRSSSSSTFRLPVSCFPLLFCFMFLTFFFRLLPIFTYGRNIGFILAHILHTVLDYATSSYSSMYFHPVVMHELTSCFFDRIGVENIMDRPFSRLVWPALTGSAPLIPESNPTPDHQSHEPAGLPLAPMTDSSSARRRWCSRRQPGATLQTAVSTKAPSSIMSAMRVRTACWEDRIRIQIHNG